MCQACLERTDSGLSGKSPAQEKGSVSWVKVGEFGGFAEETTGSSDPWEMRYENGKFLLLSGICATKDEIWACDLGISRIQVFDFAGNHKRNIGLGCPTDETLPSLKNIFYEYREKDFRGKDFWEDQFATPWRSRKRELFRVGDVVVVDDGYFVADWAKTSCRKEPQRDWGVYFIPDDGDIEPIDLGNMSFPTYLAAQVGLVALSDPICNGAWIAHKHDGSWTSETLAQGASFQRYMILDELYFDSPEYTRMLWNQSGVGTELGKYFNIGGLDIAFEKLITCDTGNNRLQVVSMVYEPDWKFGENIRVIRGNNPQGKFKFLNPLDISISHDGEMVVLDSGELEVAVLDTSFNRVGAFGKGDLVEPYAIDLSDDGKHCFISDRRDNMIYHYVRSD